MSEKQISNELMKLVKKAQIDEEQGSILYAFMAKREKNEENKKLLEKMSQDEKIHAEVWKSITKKDLKPNKFSILWFKILTVVMGFTFVVKTMQKKESLAQYGYEQMKNELPEAAKMLEDERRHEKELYNMLDEERLHYIGAMVLGLNDALVELTGAIAGLTFVLMNTKLIAMSGVITGIAAISNVFLVEFSKVLVNSEIYVSVELYNDNELQFTGKSKLTKVISGKNVIKLT